MCSLMDIYRSISTSHLGNGTTTLFWKDFWHDGELMCDKLPHLYSFVLEEDSSVANMASLEDPSTAFALPLSTEAYSEYEYSRELLNAYPLDPTKEDRRSFTWGNDRYTSARFYKFIFESSICDPSYNSIWKSKCLPKLKVFLWLLYYDRLNTKDLMVRKHWVLEDGPACPLCTTGVVETRDHLFFGCSFAADCWNLVGIDWDLQRPILDRIRRAQSSFNGACFLEIFACAVWNIWKVRNELIFQNIQPSHGRWKGKFRADLLLHQFRVKKALVLPLLQWISDLSS